MTKRDYKDPVHSIMFVKSPNKIETWLRFRLIIRDYKDTISYLDFVTVF